MVGVVRGGYAVGLRRHADKLVAQREEVRSGNRVQASC